MNTIKNNITYKLVKREEDKDLFDIEDLISMSTDEDWIPRQKPSQPPEDNYDLFIEYDGDETCPREGEDIQINNLYIDCKGILHFQHNCTWMTDYELKDIIFKLLLIK
jgi:hypothetical protein